jgi:hypothetical protein
VLASLTRHNYARTIMLICEGQSRTMEVNSGKLHSAYGTPPGECCVLVRRRRRTIKMFDMTLVL